MTLKRNQAIDFVEINDRTKIVLQCVEVIKKKKKTL